MGLLQGYWLLLLFFSSPPALQKAGNADLHITITGLRNDKGHLLLSVFNGSNGFPDKANKAVRRERLSVMNKTASCTIAALPPGTYAAAILHDENDDQKMNTNMLGIPKEGYGFSNNVTGTFGPPSFSRASFIVSSSSLSITIKTRYGL